MGIRLIWLVIILTFKTVFILCSRKFDVYLESVEYFVESNYIYIDWEFKINKYNWTTNIMDGQISIIQDMPPEISIHVIGYEKRGNKYLPSMVDVVLDICEFLKEEHVKKLFLTKSNFPKDCPVSKGNYTTQIMAVTSEDLPKEIIRRHWMLQFLIQLQGQILGELKIYTSIGRKNSFHLPLN